MGVTMARNLLVAVACLAGLAACQPPETDIGTPPDDTVQASRANGRDLFWIGSCASCHSGPGTVSLDAPALGGGQPIRSNFGTFRAPNISSDESAGIGAWSLADFDRAMRHGTSPDGRAYFPAFPYTSYARMSDQDIRDLFAFLQGLPPVAGGVDGHELGFPANMPGAARNWQKMNLRSEPVVAMANASAEVQRGQYLVEGPGHCGSCHTPRNSLGGQRLSRWLGGAEMMDETGYAPNLTPHEDGLADWSVEEIVEALRDEGDPDGPYAGMGSVRINLAQLPESDLLAIAAYLQALPPVASLP